MYGLTAIAKDYRAKMILDLSYKKFELEWWAKENLNGGGGAGAGKNADARRALADLNAMD